MFTMRPWNYRRRSWRHPSTCSRFSPVILAGIPTPSKPSLNMPIRDLQGCVGMIQAAHMLSHRHDSRPGDEIVIWSLLMGDNCVDKALDFWKATPGDSVSTDWLISDLPRLPNSNGFSWAPMRPNYELGFPAGYDGFQFPYTDSSCGSGVIRPDS